MGQYATVTWQKGDEVTSQKLQQMASNEAWLKDNLIIGNLNYPRNELGGVAGGRQMGTVPATKIEAINMTFDSTVPVLFHDVNVPLPPVFTEPPIGVVTAANLPVNERWGCMWIDDNTTDIWKLRIWDTASRAVRVSGSLNIILLGR